MQKIKRDAEAFLGEPVKGDLLLRIRVLIPEHLSPEARRLFEQLRQLGS